MRKGLALALSRLVLVSLLTLGLLTLALEPQAKSVQAKAPALLQALVIRVRDPQGLPVAFTKCEILSYDWGKPVGQPYGVIASGETDKQGHLAWDAANWPRSGYLLRLKASEAQAAAPNEGAAKSENESESEGLKAYPTIQLTAGGKSEQIYLVLTNGQVYFDTNPTGPPQYQSKSVASGPDNLSVTPIPQDSFAEIVSQDGSTRIVIGPDKTGAEAQNNGSQSQRQPGLNGNGVQYPKPARPTPGEIQVPLKAAEVEAATSPAAAGAAPGEANESDLGYSFLLAGIGLLALTLFLKYQSSINRLIGLTEKARGRGKREGKSKSKAVEARPRLTRVGRESKQPDEWRGKGS